MKKTRIVSLFVVAALLCTLFSGCSLFGGKTVLKIGGNRISEDIYASMLALTDARLQQQVGFSFSSMLDTALDEEGTTGAEVLKSNTDATITQFEAIRHFAKKNGIKLSATDRKELAESKQAQIDSVGGKKAFIDQLAESGFTEEMVDYVTESQFLSGLIYENLFVAGKEYAPDISEIAVNLANNYVRVKHILVLCSEGAEDEAEKKAKAEEALRRVRAGEDFDALIKEIGEDPGMTSSPNGYLLDKNGATPEGTPMVKEFSDASNALAVDAVSDIVRTSHGFHIIKRYPLTEEFVKENEETYVNLFAFSQMTAELAKAMEEIEVEKTKAYDEFDIHAVFDVEAPLGAGIEEHSADDGHNHEAEPEIGTPEIEVVPAE